MEHGRIVLVWTSHGTCRSARGTAIPSIRDMVQKMLSGPYLFAVPNRNFAVCWREDYAHSEEFKEQVRKDVARRPHPLTRRIFRFESGKISRVAYRHYSSPETREALANLLANCACSVDCNPRESVSIPRL